MNTTSAIEPRAWTEQEIAEQFVSEVRERARYWASVPNLTPQERCDALADSLLAILDGKTNLPAFALVPAPAEGDKADSVDAGINYYDPETMVYLNLGPLYKGPLTAQ